MFIGCWSVKGGVGTTVVSAAMALAIGEPERPALLADLAGDVATCLGRTEPAGPGLAEWLSAGTGVPPDALTRLETPVRPGLTMLHRGDGPLAPARADLLVQLLASSGRPVVIDCGRIDRCETGRRVAAQVDRSILVTRLCMMAACRAADAPVRPSGIIVVREPGRALTAEAVGEVIGAPVLAELAVDPALARAVDAGLILSRPPRRLAETLASVAA